MNQENDTTTELMQANARLHAVQADMAYLLDAYGDHLAKTHNYPRLIGIEAVHYHLIRTFHWLPRDVRSMSYEDIRFALHQELSDWKVPAAVAAQAPRASGQP